MTKAERSAQARATLHADMVDWMRERMDEDAAHIDDEQFYDVAIMALNEAVDG
jgi:hypothetical protein